MLLKKKYDSTMKTAYFDCFSGAAGDMIVGAALDAGAPQELLRRELAKLALEDVDLEIRKVSKKGIAATLFIPQPKNTLDHHHRKNHEGPHYRNLADIIDIIEHAGLSKWTTGSAIKIFQKLAQAEAKVHGASENEIHFHEIGAVDSIMDIVGACVALESLAVEEIYCSPLVVGRGMVKCAHGLLPVPAPATAELIKGIEILPSEVEGELLTPTGAAILTTLASGFGPMPALEITDIGYGAGQNDNPQMPNVLRLIVGQKRLNRGSDVLSDTVCLLEANIDDATGQLIGHVTEVLLQAGALDVYTTAITMKQNRPAVTISVICPLTEADRMEKILFMESTTLGIRRQNCRRSVLPRVYQTVATAFGDIKIKLGYFQGQPITCTPEFADCQRAARQHQVPVKEVIAAALAAYNAVKT